MKSLFITYDTDMLYDMYNPGGFNEQSQNDLFKWGVGGMFEKSSPDGARIRADWFTNIPSKSKTKALVYENLIQTFE